ncbi:hypothetical protein [Dickeya sp. ws52]|uniref:hypothetical protein n=1 Tax=Dickeya sp. ws52 TaxID=2576377 RepID=UPI001F21D030|nr:hypothetical protein [Dickeya sp. ws52]
MKKIILIALPILITSGCVTFKQMDEGLSSLVGKNKDVAFNVLGYPSKEQSFDKTKVYTWNRATSETILLSSPQTTYGTVGATTFNSTTTQLSAVPVQYACTIQLATDEAGTIKQYQYDGNMGGCEPYIHRLNAYFKR